MLDDVTCVGTKGPFFVKSLDTFYKLDQTVGLVEGGGEA